MPSAMDRTDHYAGAMLYQLSYEATQLGAGQFNGLICIVPMKESMNERKYILKCGL